MDDMKITIALIFVLVFTAAIVYYLNEKIKYLEYAVSKQNQVLSEFISNVQKQVILGGSLGSSSSSSDNTDNIKIIKNNGYEKIPISDDEDDDSDDDSYSDSDDDSDDDSEEVSDNEEEDNSSEDKERTQNNDNIKVIELINDIVEEVHDVDADAANGVEQANCANSADAADTSSKNVKKIELDDEGDIDIVGSKKMSVAELRALVVSKGLANTASANKMKKIELNDLLQKFSQ